MCLVRQNAASSSLNYSQSKRHRNHASCGFTHPMLSVCGAFRSQCRSCLRCMNMNATRTFMNHPSHWNGCFLVHSCVVEMLYVHCATHYFFMFGYSRCALSHSLHPYTRLRIHEHSVTLTVFDSFTIPMRCIR